MQLLKSIIPILLAGFLLAGCNLRAQSVKSPTAPATGTPSITVSPTSTGEVNPPENGTPSPEATQTLTAVPTLTLTHTSTPTQTYTPTITQTLRPSRTPTKTATITNTPTLNPKANLLRIAEPGPMSKVTSPIDLTFYISPDFVGTTHIDLIGEDGRQLFTKSFRTFATEGSTKVSEKVKFNIPGTAEVARLQVSTFDKSGQMLAFNSVRLLLLSVGETQLNPPFPAIEHVLLRLPKWGATINGGSLNVQGEIQPVNDRPLVIELFDETGALLATQALTLKPADGTYQTFNITLTYHIARAKLPARLVIRQDDDRITGLVYFYSRQLLLNP